MINKSSNFWGSLHWGLSPFARFSFPVSSILSLKDSRSLIHLNRVPSAPRNLDTKHAVPGANPKPGSLHKLRLIRSGLAIMNWSAGIHASHLLIEHPVQAPLQANHRLAGLEVSMNWHTRTPSRAFSIRWLVSADVVRRSYHEPQQHSILSISVMHYNNILRNTKKWKTVLLQHLRNLKILSVFD